MCIIINKKGVEILNERENGRDNRLSISEELRQRRNKWNNNSIKNSTNDRQNDRMVKKEPTSNIKRDDKSIFNNK